MLSRRFRPVLVWICASVVLGLVAGSKLFKPSSDNHYSHMASAWLAGRTSLPGSPPHRNDWGRVTTLTLHDGRTLRGIACKTASCREHHQRTNEQGWWSMDHQLVYVSRADVITREDAWYVTFPPGPAVMLLPLVALFGIDVWDVLLTVLLAAACPAVLVAFFDRERGLAPVRAQEHVLAAAAWTLASPACFVGANGSVWFTAHIAGVLFAFLYVSAAWELRHPVLSGVWLGAAMSCRPPIAFAIVFALLEWWRVDKRLHRLFGLLIPVGIFGIAMATYNVVRFDAPFEFGHRYLDIRWQEQMQDIGMMSLHWLPRNLHAMLLLTPELQHARLRWSVHGMSLLLGSPWLLLGLLLAPWARLRFPQRKGLWIAAAIVAIPTLLYHNTGQLQFTYRFALDWLPFVLVALVFGNIAGSRWFGALVVVGAAIELWGAWMFAHAPGKLFRHDGWPYFE